MFSTSRKFIVPIVILVLLLSACAPAAAPEPAAEEQQAAAESDTCTMPEEIRIGWIDSMTGQNATGGEMDWRGAELAHKQRDNVNGVPVKMVLVDDKSDRTEAALAASRLIEVEDVDFVIGAWTSSIALSIVEVTEKANIGFLTPTCTNPLITANRPLNFRMNYIDPYQGFMLAKYAIDNLGAKNTAIIMDVQQDFSVGLAKFYRDAFIKLTGDPQSVLGMLSFQSGDKDFTAQLTQVKALGADVVFLPYYYNEVGLTLKQASDLGMKPPEFYFLGTNGADAPELIPVAGAAGEGFLFSTSYEPSAFTSEMSTKFFQDFKAEYGIDPDYSATSSFDSYNVALDAIERAGCVRTEDVLKALAATSDWEGVGGKVTFDSNGDPAKTIIIIRIENGQRVIDTMLEPVLPE